MTLRRTLSANIAFLSLMILAACAVVSGTAYVLHRQYRVACADALERSALDARIFEEHLNRSLETVQRFADFTVIGSEPGSMNELLRRTVRQTPFLRSLSQLGADGRILASSNSANIGASIDITDFFPHASPLTDTTLRIGSPWSGRDFNEARPATAAHPVSADSPGIVPVLCRVKGDDRQILVLAALNPDYFVNSFSQWLDADTGYAEVLRYDQVPLLTSDQRPLTGESLANDRYAKLWREAEIGRFTDPSDSAPPALTAYRVSRHYPLVVVTRLYQHQALTNWRRESGRLLAFAVPALLTLAYLATTLYRKDRQKVRELEATRRRDYERLAATVFETVLEAVVVADGDGRIIAVNPAFIRITGYTAAEAVGADLSLLATGSDQDNFSQILHEALSNRGHWEGEVRHRRKSGEVFVAWLSINQVRDDAGKILHLVTGFADITQYWAEAERISHLAHHDPLTGLPNRALLIERLQQGVRQAQRDSKHLCLLFFDLDKFKPVNDQLGHAVGDLLLQALALRLSGVVRAADTLARLGGDEFVILLHGVRNRRAGEVVAEKIRQSAEEPFVINGHQIRVSTSIGIAFFPEHATDGDGLLQCADSAMYRAKALGGNRFEIYRKTDGEGKQAKG